MATFTTRHIVIAGVTAAGVFAAGLGTAQAFGDAEETPKAQPAESSAPAEDPMGGGEEETDWYESTLELEDGRTVHVRLVEGTGVQERHRAADGDKWSAWKTLYASKSERCQGVDLEEVNGTVSLIADFGRFCSEGEPPQKSLAAVGTGDLTEWDVDTSEGFDGWEDASINGDGSKVLFLYNSDAGLYTLNWKQGEGFGPLTEPTA